MKKVTTSEYTLYYAELKSLLIKKYEKIKIFNNLFFLYLKFFKKEIDELNKLSLDINYYDAFNKYYYEHYLDNQFSFDSCSRYGKAKIKYQEKVLKEQNERFYSYKKFYVSEDKINGKKLNDKFHLIMEKYDPLLICYDSMAERIFNNALLYFCCNNIDGLDAVLNYPYQTKKKEILNIEKLIAKIKNEVNQKPDENLIHYENVLKDKNSINKEKEELIKRINELKINYSDIIDEYQNISNKFIS